MVLFFYEFQSISARLKVEQILLVKLIAITTLVLKPKYCILELHHVSLPEKV